MSLYVFSHSPSGFAAPATSHHSFTPQPTLASSADNTGVVVVLVVVVVLAVLSTAIVTVIVVFTLRRMKTKKVEASYTFHDQENEMTHYSVIQLDNPTYSTAGIV